MAKRAPAKARKPARRAPGAKARPASRAMRVDAGDAGAADAAEDALGEAAENRVVADTPLPESLTLASHYAYYGDDGALHVWAQGQVVTNARDIADLIARGAPARDRD